MSRRLFCVFCWFFVLSGCVYNDEPMPEIAYDYTSGPIQPQYQAYNSIDNSKTAIERVPVDWFAVPGLERRWTAIIIHHSGTDSGSASVFDKWHRQGNHWDGVGYDFVIGNGSDSGDGQVEVTYRWRYQKTGAHCGGTAGNWANREAVGVCLVGNFNHQMPTSRQMHFLARLVRFLQRRYGIAKSRIYGHSSTPGVGPTDCPGKMFPMAEFKSLLEF